MAKFNVGDKVRRIDKPNSWNDGRKLEVGTICTVVRVYGNDIDVEVDGVKYEGNIGKYFELVEKAPKPREFKVGDRVKVTEIGYNEWENLKEKGVDLGTVIVYNGKSSIGVKFDKDFGGHDCGNKDCKYGHGWWLTDKEIELVKEEHKEEPTPTPVVNVNVTVNLYENACWYCRKGGLVDLYLAGAMGICPSCGRVCNNTTPTKPKKESVVIEFKPRKKNKPLTKKELEALPNGTKVYIVWRWDMASDSKKEPVWHESGWGVKNKSNCKWSYEGCDEAWQGIDTYDRTFDAYLEEPERPLPEPEIEIPF